LTPHGGATRQVDCQRTVGEALRFRRQDRKECAAKPLLHSLLAPRHSFSLYARLLHPTRGGCSKATGQIQNREDFFEAGIAEVPTTNCLNSGLEFGARVEGGNFASETTRSSQGRFLAELAFPKSRCRTRIVRKWLALPNTGPTNRSQLWRPLFSPTRPSLRRLPTQNLKTYPQFPPSER
jgi:hypothetical protein